MRSVTGRDLRDATLGAVATTCALLLAAVLVPGLALTRWFDAPVVAVAVGALDAVVRPSLRPVAQRLGVPGAVLLGVAGQVLVVHLALQLVPGVELTSWAATFATLGVVTVVLVLARWLVGVGDRDYLVADLLRRTRPEPGSGRARPPGLVIIQIDGLAAPVLRHAITSGEVPVLAGWLRAGTHLVQPWWARVPSTTPASQAGLLHGRNDQIPAFRWFDKSAGRLVVTNHPADAAAVEAELSDGHGLLAGGGATVSAMFTGDAARAQLVMSRAGRVLGPGGDYLRFFARPFVLGRAVLLTVGEMVKEVVQASRQRRRQVWPRVPRRASYVLARAATNVVLRDLSVALVAEQLARGTPVVFVDLVDYDEIAHHAGVLRREALDSLAGVDAAIGTVARVAERCPRDYRFVVLSDHGQSQGPTFSQLAGRSLAEVVTELVGQVTASTGVAEIWGPLSTLLSDVLAAAGARGRLARWSPGARDRREATGAGDPVVAASGNLGLVWFPRLPGRVDLSELTERFPALVPGLLAQPGVGFVVVASARGPLAVGARGVHVLAEGAVEGEDPLACFGPRAAPDLLRVARMTHAPDVLVHSTCDPQTREVHAFEELVGSHGGLGGAQNRAFVLHPADWPVDADLLDTTVPGDPVLLGAEVVHAQLVRWLERAGLREPAPAPDREPR